MGEFVISAERDNSATSAVSGHHSHRETAAPGTRRNTEIWHIPREFTPNKPLCGADLAGKFKRTKGLPNCTTCNDRLSLRTVYSHYYPTLRALYLNQTVPPYAEPFYGHDGLYDADLIATVKSGIVLTSRGKIVACDLVSPVGWYDTQTRLYHARRALEVFSLCGVPCGQWVTRTDAFTGLHEEARKSGRKTVTCVRCATYVERRADVD